MRIQTGGKKTIIYKTKVEPTGHMKENFENFVKLYLHLGFKGNDEFVAYNWKLC